MEGLKTANTYLTEISIILKPSFGPNGKDILLKSSTGVTYVTKNGESIVQQLEVKHPIARLIKNSVQNYTKCSGDFSKTYLLLLDSLIGSLTNTYMNGVNVARPQRLHSTLSFISNSLLKLKSKLSSDFVLGYMNANGYILKVSADEFMDKYFDGLYTVVVCGKFNSAIMNVLKRILKDIFQHIEITRTNLSFIIKKFTNLCITVNGIPFGQSQVVEGVIIQREPVPQHTVRTHCTFILISGKTTRSSCSNIELSLHGESGLLRQQHASKKFYERLVGIITDLGISIVFTEERLPLLFCTLLKSKNITYVSFVLEEDLEWLSEVYEISPLSGLYDILNIQNSETIIGRSTFFKSCILGTHVCSHLGPPESDTSKSSLSSKAYQIIVCALYEGITSQYSEAIFSFLKSVYQCFSMDDEMLLIPACGFFELFLINIFKDAKRDVVVCGGGEEKYSADEVFNGEAKYLEESFTAEENEIVSLFSQSLHVIPKSIFDNSNKVKCKRYISCVTGLNCTLGVDGCTGEMIGPKEVKLYVPFNSKIQLFWSLLDVCAQVVRLHHVIPLKELVYQPPDSDEDSE